MPTRKHGSGTTTQQGYGYTHQQERKRRLATHHPAHLCCLCGHALGPAGPNLHLDHCPCKTGCPSCAGTGYRGLAHGKPCPTCGKTCNQRDGAVRGNKARRPQPVTRRQW